MAKTPDEAIQAFIQQRMFYAAGVGSDNEFMRQLSAKIDKGLGNPGGVCSIPDDMQFALAAHIWERHGEALLQYMNTRGHLVRLPYQRVKAVGEDKLKALATHSYVEPYTNAVRFYVRDENRAAFSALTADTTGL